MVLPAEEKPVTPKCPVDCAILAIFFRIVVRLRGNREEGRGKGGVNTAIQVGQGKSRVCEGVGEGSGKSL